MKVCLTDGEQGGFRVRRGCVDQIFTLKQIGEKTREKKHRVYVGFMDLEKAYDRVNMCTLWQVLKPYDVGSKLLNGIKTMHVNSLACVIVKGSERECFSIDSGVRQRCIVSPWLFNVYMDAVMNEVKMGMRKRGVRYQEEGREWILPGLLYADDLVLCGESEKDLKAMVEFFGEMCRKRDLKVNVRVR